MRSTIGSGTSRHLLDERLEHVVRRSTDEDIGVAITGRWGEVDDGEARAGVSRMGGEIGRGIDGQGRADDDEKIGGPRSTLGFGQLGARHWLAEENRRRLDDAAARRALRNAAREKRRPAMHLVARLSRAA